MLLLSSPHSSHFPASSTSIVVGRSDTVSTHGEVEWETVTKMSRDHSVYEFSVVIGDQERRFYRWKRTHDPAVKDSKSVKWNMRSWKLEDNSTGQVIAVYAANMLKFGQEAGTINIVAGNGVEWEQWIILT